MSIITFFFWLYIVRVALYLIILGASTYPRKKSEVGMGSDVSQVILSILVCIWVGLVKYGIIGVNL